MPDGSAGHRLATRIAANAVPLLAAALCVVTLLAVVGWTRAAERERFAAALAQRLAVAAVPNVRPMQVEPPSLYRAEFRFPAGVAELDAAGRARLGSIVADLRRRVADLPNGGGWLVVVEGAIGRAADGDGLLVAAWDLALLRVGVTVQHLVAQGLPPERVSVRFHAGVQGARRSPSRPQSVALSLVCCLPDPPEG
jgi:hypothetical protein